MSKIEVSLRTFPSHKTDKYEPFQLAVPKVIYDKALKLQEAGMFFLIERHNSLEGAVSIIDKQTGDDIAFRRSRSDGIGLAADLGDLIMEQPLDQG